MMIYGFDMVGYDLARWITLTVMVVVLLYPIGRILTRVGLSPSWVIPMLAPLFNLTGLWVPAFVEWPRQGSDRPG